MFFIGLVVGMVAEIVLIVIIGVPSVTKALNNEYDNGVRDGETMYKFNQMKAEEQINLDKMKRWETK